MNEQERERERDEGGAPLKGDGVARDRESIKSREECSE